MNYRIIFFGNWAPGNVKTTYRESLFLPWPHDLAMRARTLWTNLQQEDERLYNGSLYSLKRASVAGGKLNINLSKTNYRDQIFANKNIKFWSAEQQVRYAPRALGVSALVETSDGTLLFMLRSRKVHEYPRHIDVFGGHVDWKESHVNPPDPFEAITSELTGELGIRSENIQSQTCIGLLKNIQIFKPELVFRINLNIDSNAVIALARSASEKFEYDEILSVAATPDELQQFQQKKAKELTPAANGSIELFLNFFARQAP